MIGKVNGVFGQELPSQKALKRPKSVSEMDGGEEEPTMGLFLLVTIAFLMGHSVARYVRSLAPLTPLTRSATLHFARLALLARFIHRLAHSLSGLFQIEPANPWLSILLSGSL